MQTFLPFESFTKSALVLDRQRLGKQRVETMQIMTALCEGRGWIHHPVTKMWRGHESWLMGYQSAVCREWVARGYADTCFKKTEAIYMAVHSGAEHPRPPWLGDPALHRAHRSNLLRKDPLHYKDFFEDDLPDDLPYIYPVQ